MESTTSPSITTFLRRHALEQPNRKAVIDSMTGETLTYSELLTATLQLKNGLTGTGISAGMRVGIVALNSLRNVKLILALAEIGAIAVPLNLRLNPKEAAANLADAETEAIVTDKTMLPLAEAVSAATNINIKLTLEDSEEGWISTESLHTESSKTGDQTKTSEPSGSTPATLLFTSGTTGRAKGCILTHRTWVGYGRNMAASIKMDRDDVYLAFLPYFHVAGLGTMLSQLVLGGTVVTLGVSDPQKMYQAIADHGVTIVFVVPGISGPFVDFADRDSYDVASLRLVISGAGMERLRLGEQVAERLGADYCAIYGQTEAGTKITWATLEQQKQNPDTYGYLMPGISYRIVDENDNDVPDGTPGELIIRSETVMNGYWNREDATAETLRGGWHHTGDTFVHEGDGLVRMVDRTKYLIKTGGENVYPQEVETALKTHPSIADNSVIGIPDPDWGETVKAFVVVKEGAEITRAEVDEWARKSIAGYKVPRFVEFIDVIPRNESGKVLKNLLAEHETTPDQRVIKSGAPND